MFVRYETTLASRAEEAKAMSQEMNSQIAELQQRLLQTRTEAEGQVVMVSLKT